MSTFGQQVVSDVKYFFRDMAFSPQRMAGTLRLALSIALATLVLLILQPPAFTIAPSVYMLFLVPHDTPKRCFGGLVQCLGGALLGTLVALSLVIVTENHPMARVMGLAVCTFLATYFFRASVVPLASLSFGSLSFMVIALWELQVRAERVLHLSLWPLGTLATVALCSLAVEYLLNRNDPLMTLRREMRARFEALEQLSFLFVTSAGEEQFRCQAMKLKRYAVTGQGALQALLERIKNEREISIASLNNLQKRALLLTRLLDLAAAFSLQSGFAPLGSERLERIRLALSAARDERFEDLATIFAVSAQQSSDLNRFERALCELAETKTTAPAADKATAVCHARSTRAPRSSWLVPDAFTNSAYFIYAFKLSLCGTICYVIYNGVGWPGISTSYFTVLFTGLTTTGATNRKLLFRLIGSTIGGLFLGIGCLAFVFPNIESVTGFLLVIATVTFIAAWVAASPYFSYIGLQIAFSFYLLAFERLSAPTELTPARDRLLGIALGLIVMFLIFDQVHPERTVDTMRRTFARILHAEAELVRAMAQESSALVPSPECIALRTQIEQLVAAVHSYAEVVSYERDPDRTADMAISNEILTAMSTSGDLMLNIGAWPQAADAQPLNGKLRALRDQLANGLHSLGRSLEQPAWKAKQSTDDQPFEALHITQSAIAQKTLDCYRRLQMFCEGVVSARV